MTTLVERPAPVFMCPAVMPEGSFEQLSLTDFCGKYVLLFFYPLDVTFVCPTEIIAFPDHFAASYSKPTLNEGIR